MKPLVLRQPEIGGFDELEDALLEAFRRLVAHDGPCVVVLRDVDVAGHGDPAAAALAHALFGLVRALAIEGFVVNALSGDDPGPDEGWVDRLADPQGLNGQLVRVAGRGPGTVAP
jgi:hypothetical protein